MSTLAKIKYIKSLVTKVTPRLLEIKKRVEETRNLVDSIHSKRSLEKSRILDEVTRLRSIHPVLRTEPEIHRLNKYESKLKGIDLSKASKYVTSATTELTEWINKELKDLSTSFDGLEFKLVGSGLDSKVTVVPKLTDSTTELIDTTITSSIVTSPVDTLVTGVAVGSAVTGTGTGVATGTIKIT